MKISDQALKEIRSYIIRNDQSKAGSCARFVIVNGKSPPIRKGSPGYYQTKTGKPVYYPNAYRRAWGKPIYVHSTKRIEVGKDWLKQLEIDLIQVKMSRERRKFVGQEIAKFVFNFGNSY